MKVQLNFWPYLCNVKIKTIADSVKIWKNEL